MVFSQVPYHPLNYGGISDFSIAIPTGNPWDTVVLYPLPHPCKILLQTQYRVIDGIRKVFQPKLFPCSIKHRFTHGRIRVFSWEFYNLKV